MIDTLNNIGKEFKLKFDILTPKFLTEVAKEGSRLLSITSDFFEPDQLCIEGVHGVSEKIPLQELQDMLEQIAPSGLPIDVIDIALPQSVKIGQVFSALKVKHVLCYDEVNMPEMIT